MFGGIRVVREITVGIVDNDRFVLPSLKTSIEELSDDMQVIWTTSDGGQAVSNCLTASTRPKVLLADMSMEGVSGISVCRRIRTRIGKVGILAMTAYSIDKYAEKASLAGAQGIVGKSDDQQIVTDPHHRLRRDVGRGIRDRPDRACAAEEPDLRQRRADRP